MVLGYSNHMNSIISKIKKEVFPPTHTQFLVLTSFDFGRKKNHVTYESCKDDSVLPSFLGISFTLASKDILVILITVSNLWESLSAVHPLKSFLRKIFWHCYRDTCFIKSICLFNFRHWCPIETNNFSNTGFWGQMKTNLSFSSLFPLSLKKELIPGYCSCGLCFPHDRLVNRKLMPSGGHLKSETLCSLSSTCQVVCMEWPLKKKAKLGDSPILLSFG